MRHNRWTYYHDWCEIFGNDLATDDKCERFIDAVQDVLKTTSEVLNKIGMTLEDLFNANEGAAESISVSTTPDSKPTATAKLKSKNGSRLMMVMT